MSITVTRQWPDGTVSRLEPVSEDTPVGHIFDDEEVATVTVTLKDGRTAVFTKAEHVKVKFGPCPLCGHYGEDCTGNP